MPKENWSSRVAVGIDIDESLLQAEECPMETLSPPLVLWMNIFLPAPFFNICHHVSDNIGPRSSPFP
jgi:hypothetical protein